MKVLIKEIAGHIYGNVVHVNTHGHDQKIQDFWNEYAGKELEIDTDYLFENAFNAIYPKEAKEKYSFTCDVFHLETIFVEKVIDDVRDEKTKCHYCGQIWDKSEIGVEGQFWQGMLKGEDHKACPNCESTGYFIDLGWHNEVKRRSAY